MDFCRWFCPISGRLWAQWSARGHLFWTIRSGHWRPVNTATLHFFKRCRWKRSFHIQCGRWLPLTTGHRISSEALYSVIVFIIGWSDMAVTSRLALYTAVIGKDSFKDFRLKLLVSAVLWSAFAGFITVPDASSASSTFFFNRFVFALATSFFFQSRRPAHGREQWMWPDPFKPLRFCVLALWRLGILVCHLFGFFDGLRLHVHQR